MSLIENYIEARLGSIDTSIARDFKLNLKKLIGESSLSTEEALMASLALAATVHDISLQNFAREALVAQGVASEAIVEAEQSAAIMGMLNTYYKFKGLIGASDDYKAAGLRMQSLSKPILGKERFEMLAFAISVVNACPTCVTSHEQVLRQHGVVPEKIHDLARLASVIKGLTYI